MSFMNKNFSILVSCGVLASFVSGSQAVATQGLNSWPVENLTHIEQKTDKVVSQNLSEESKTIPSYIKYLCVGAVGVAVLIFYYILVYRLRNYVILKCREIGKKICSLYKEYTAKRSGFCNGEDPTGFLWHMPLNEKTEPLLYNLAVIFHETHSMWDEMTDLRNKNVVAWNRLPPPGIWKDGSPQWDEMSLWNKMLLWKKMMQRYFNILYLIKCIRRQNEILTILDDETYLKNNKIKSNFDY